MATYLDKPAAVAALIRDDEVHRDVYTHPEIFTLEMRHLWSRSWIYIGHESQVAQPGDYVTVEKLMYALLLTSANDAAMALAADHRAGVNTSICL